MPIPPRIINQIGTPITLSIVPDCNILITAARGPIAFATSFEP